jgi:hypothetical protein
MKINQSIVDKLQGEWQLRANIALKLNKTPNSIERWLRENKIDGPLTKLTALTCISQVLSVPVANLVETFEKSN